MIDVKVDTSQLERAIYEAAKRSDKTLTEIVNKKLRFIVSNAIKETVKASAQEIREIFSHPEDAGRLINWMRRNHGEPGLYGSEMKTAIRKVVSRRVSACNFIRSQWKWALRDIAMSIGGFYNDSKMSKRMGGAKSAAKNAAGIINAKAYSDVQGGKEESSFVTQIKQDGLQKAIDKETESTWKHIVEKEYQSKVCSIF